MRSDFELGIDNLTQRRGSGSSFSREANAWYNYESAEALLANIPDLEAMIEDFLSVQVPRLSVLASYASGYNPGIEGRPGRTEPNKADHRAKHDYAGFISLFNTGYLFGVPVKVSAATDPEQEEINAFNEINHIDELNSDLGYDCSRFGRAFELHYRGKDDKNKVALSSAFDTFVIYDPTVEHKPVAAVRLMRQKSRTETKIKVDLYTDKEIIHFKECSVNQIKLHIETSEPHKYGAVPVIEWFNNRFRQGDFETVISLIDLYDAGQSDTANYMSDLNEALLVIRGSLAEADLDVNDIKAMRDANLLLLESGRAVDGRELPLDAGYIYKQYDVAGTEAYKKRLQADIHKFSHTPDFTDMNFAGQQTGVALKYKLLGAEQVRALKERAFERAIKDRYKLLSQINKSVFGQDIDVENLAVEFTENLPVDFWQDVQNFYKAGGRLSQQTLISLLPWVGSNSEEKERLAEEDGEALPFYDKLTRLAEAGEDEG